MERQHLAVAERGRPHRHGGAVLDLARVGDHAARAAADERHRARASRGRPRASPRAPRGARRRRTGPRGRTARPSSPRAAADAASSAPARASGVVERPVAMCTLTRLTILRAVRVIAIFGPTGVGKTEVAIALAERLRADGRGPGRDLRRRAAGLRRAGDPLRRGDAPRSRRASSTGCVGVVPVDRALQRRRLRGAARTPRSTPRSPPAGGRSWSAAPASTCAPRWPTSTCARRAAAGPRAAGRRELTARGPEALHAELAERAPAVAAGIAPSRRPPARARARAARRRRRAAAAAGGDSQLWTTDTRHPTLLAGLVMERDALRERIDRRVDAMVAAGARRGGPARRRARRLARPRARRWASRSCSRATSRR